VEKEYIEMLPIPEIDEEFKKSRWEMIFQAAHHNPMAGHLGGDKTCK